MDIEYINPEGHIEDSSFDGTPNVMTYYQKRSDYIFNGKNKRPGTVRATFTSPIRLEIQKKHLDSIVNEKKMFHSILVDAWFVVLSEWFSANVYIRSDFFGR